MPMPIRHFLRQTKKYIVFLPKNEARVDVNEVTGEESPVVQYIDFEHPENNIFHAINQFRIDTPGRVREICLRKKDLHRARDAFKSLYKTRGRDKIMKRVHYYAPFLKKQPSTVTIKDLGNRWGSCLKRQCFFYWKVTLAPMQIVDYIVVHELCHLEHPNHSTSFWDEVYRILPDYEERKQWLDKNGASLEI